MSKREKKKSGGIGRCDSLIVEGKRIPSQHVFTGMV